MTTIVYLGMFAYFLGALYGLRRANAKLAGGLPSRFWLHAVVALGGWLLIDRANTWFNEGVGALLSKNSGLITEHPIFFAFFATGALVTAFFSWSCAGYALGLLNARFPAKTPAAAVEAPAAPAKESAAS